jgi:uncharacterized phage protein (TIGR02218 family)
MKTVSVPGLALLQNSSQFYIAEVLMITLSDGTTLLCYVMFDSDVSWNTHTYLSKGLLLKRSKITQVRGIEVDELEVEAYPTTALIGGIGFLSACKNGALDGATIKLERLYFTTWGTAPLFGYTLFSGIVSDIEMGRTYAKIKVRSSLELLQSPWPHLVYQPGCVWSLYSTGCGASKAAFPAGFMVTGAVIAGTLTAGSFSTNLTQADGYFDLGVIKFTSGLNSGLRRTIKSFLHTSGIVNVILPLDNLPVAADAFEIYPGCDHQLTTCASKFSRSASFRGFPYIPIPETAY